MSSTTLATYNRKRDFGLTPEPRGNAAAARGAGRFVVQKHAARSLHYDFRLEWNGVLRSWAIPKGPSLDPAVKRMAVQTEDHPLAYAGFEGTIPKGQYGAGKVGIWDHGTWEPIGDARKGLAAGRLKFLLRGGRLNGAFMLVRMRQREGERQGAWLLIKERDAFAAAPNVAATPRPAAGRRRSKRPRLPATLSPQLATLVEAPPADGHWHFELKLDGYRILTRADGNDVRCLTRNGNDWSSRLPGLVKAIRALGLPPCWLDGEIVVLGRNGAPDFQLLQNAFEKAGSAPVRYFVFDLLFLDGEDLRELPQLERRERLRALLGDRAGGPVQFSATLEGQPKQLLAAARKAGFEGLVGKRDEAVYRAGRSRDWIKLKGGLRQEFVVGGFTDPQGSRTGIGSLLLGVYDGQGKLRHAGNVGTGFDMAQLASLRARLRKLETADSPFTDGPRHAGTGRRLKPHWIRPTPVAEVSFAGWTKGGQVRHAVFHGLREDKPARQIRRERASRPPAVTHPERVIDTQSGATKGDLAAYCGRVGSLLLPHLANRPVSLLRAPAGVAGKQFFQKHARAGALPELVRLPRKLDPGHDPLLMIPSEQALMSAVQMNVVEFHTWNATVDAIARPDRLVLDLDPGEGVDWPQVRESALLVRALLQELELRSFVKTSGGKGLHVVVPLKPELGWTPVKAFSKSLVEHLARVLPDRFVAVSGPRNRVGRIFADYLRNGRGATTVAAWSPRARPGVGISVPLSWRELERAGDRPEWNVLNAGRRLSTGNRPWKDYESARQGLRRAVDTLKRAMGKRAIG